MIKNITIITLITVLLTGTLYHNTTVNTLQDKSDTCLDCGFSMWSDSWCEYHMGGYVNEIEQLKHEHSTPVVIGMETETDNSWLYRYNP